MVARQQPGLLAVKKGHRQMGTSLGLDRGIQIVRRPELTELAFYRDIPAGRGTYGHSY